MRKAPLLLVLAALARPACAQYVQRIYSIPFDRPDAYDGLMVATAVGPAVRHPFKGASFLDVQPFRVDDSRAFAPGTTVDVYYESVGDNTSGPHPGDPQNTATRAVPVGARALVVAAAAHGGVLNVLNFPLLNQRNDRAIPLDDAGPAALALAWYPTTAARLPDDRVPAWRLFGAIAAAMPGAPEWSAGEIAYEIAGISNTAMQTSLPDGGPDDRGPLGVEGPDDRLSRTFAGAVAKDTAYHRALVDHALNHLRYWGYGFRFGRDLLAAADDPNAFPDGVPPLEYHEESDNAFRVPEEFKNSPLPPEMRSLAVLAHAKSPTIAAALIGEFSTKPSDADVNALAARYLNFPDPRPRWAIVERLAFWYGASAPEKPTRVLDPVVGVYRDDYPGLDASVAYWKAKLGV